MKTPDTPAGRATDRIMLRILEEVPHMNSFKYNRIFSMVLEEVGRAVAENCQVGEECSHPAVDASEFYAAAARARSSPETCRKITQAQLEKFRAGS